MKAILAGRETEVSWDHFLTVAAIIIAYALVFGLVVGGAAFLSDGKVLGPSYTYYSRLATDITGVFAQPLFAWLFLRQWKGKKDDKLCLSLAASAFLLESALSIATSIAYIWLLPDLLNPAFIVSDILLMLSGIAVAAFGSIILYWWMLFFLKREDGRAKTSAIYGFSIALAFYVLSYLALFAMEYYQGRAFTPAVGLSDLIGFAGKIVFGSIIIYYAGGRKIVWNDAYLFAGLYLAGAILGLVYSLFIAASEPGGAMVNVDAITLVERVVWLGLLYVAATNWKDSL